jgi:hypothetical protein
MQNEVQLIVKSGGIVTTEYTVTFANCPAAEIVCALDKIDISAVTPTLSTDIWQQLADEGGTIDLYDGSDNYLASLTINSFDGTSILFFDTTVDCALVEGIACYFKFSLDVNTEVEYFLDLYPNESISLSYQFTDLNNFSQIGTFSRDFRIPATKKNVEALGPLYDYNFVDDVQSFSRKYTAELRVDTIPISRGYIRVMAAYKQQDFLSDFQVAFYSEAPNFVKSIGEKKLKDLTVLPTLSEPVVFTNVTTINSTRIWALIDRGQGGKAFSETGETNTRPTQNDAQPLYAADLTPCLRSDYILQQIFNDAGFELDASSLLTTLSDYYVPWVNTESLNFNFAVSDNALRVTNSTAINHTTDFGWQIIPLDNEDYDNGMNYNAATYTYTTPYTGYYSFRLYFTFENASCWTSIQLRLKYNDGSNDYYISFGTHQPIVFDGVLGYTSGDLFFSAGWTIQFQYLGYDNYSSVDCPTPNVDLIANGFVLELMNLKPLTGPDIIYSNNAPDIKQIDFVSDIIKMHNLAVIPDAAGVNKLLLEPMSTYLGSGATLDWTKKLDTSKDIVIKGTDDIKKSKLYFTYSAGQDTYSKLFVDQGRIYGDYKLEPYTVDANQVPSEFLTGSTEVKLIAQSTPSTQVNGSSLICPRFWTQSGDEPPKFTAPGLRFLYWSETAPIYLYDEGFGGSVVYQNVPLVNHYNDTSGFNPNFAGQYDLNWAPETPLHDYTMNPQNNLFTQYWRDYLDSIYSDDARILEASFALNNTDILSLNFGDYVFVKDAYWRIIELSDYKMGQYESTRVKLLKVSPGAPAKPACDIIPVSNNQDGSVNFETPAGASVSATQYCCNYFNFTWSVNTNLCYGKVRDRPGITNPNNDSTGKGEITSLNSISVGANNVITTVGLDAGSSTFSVFAGNEIKVSGTNDNLIAVGDTLEVKGDQRGIAMFGKSVESAVPGLVVGGGWPQDDRSYAFNGSQSAGTFMMSEQGTYAATLGTLELFIEGIANKRLELEDNTAWYMRMQVMVQPTINQYINATITAQIGKSSGIAFATAPIVQYQDTSMAGRTVNLIIDTATNTAQHRMNIQLAGGTYPFITRLVAQINYTQFR